MYIVSGKKWPLQLVNNNFKSKSIVKMFYKQNQQYIAKITIYFCSNNIVFSSTAKVTCLLTVPVSSIFQ